MNQETFEHIEANFRFLNVDYFNGVVRNRKAHENGHGYLKISLGSRKVYIHNIIAFMKYGKESINHEVNHLDGDKTNNKPYNIVIGTRSQNVKHAYDNGWMVPKSFKGSSNGMAKLTEDDVIKIKKMLNDGLSPKEIANEFNTTHKNISAIKVGKRWKHVSID